MSKIISIIKNYRVTEVVQIQKITFWITLSMFSMFWIFYFIFAS